MKRGFAIAAMLVLAAACALWFLRPAPTPQPTRYLIGMSQANLIEPWRVTMNLEFQKAAEKHADLRVIYTDAAENTDRQIEDVEMLMGYGVDLLVISPNDSEALRPVLSEVYQRIPVIVLDRAVSGEDYTLFIGPDNRQIGALVGERVLEMLGEEGGTVVEILGTPDSPPVAARQEGFQAVLRGQDRIRLEQSLPGNWMQDQAQDRFKEYLVVHGKTADVVAAQNDAMAYGAYLAAEALRVEGIRFIGVDGLQGEGGGVDLVHRGILDSTIYCPTGASQAVEYSLKILRGESLPQKQLILSPLRITAGETAA